MHENNDDLMHKAEALIEENFSTLSTEHAEKLWNDILDFIENNHHVTADDFIKVIAILQEEQAYAHDNAHDEILDESLEHLDDTLDFDEPVHDLLPDAVEEDKTLDSPENENNHTEKHEIQLKDEANDLTDNTLQDDLITLILHDVNTIADEARSKALEHSLGGLSTSDPYYLDKMIAQAPHQVVKGTLKALYQHVGGMYQNLVYGSEIYPDEVGFGGAIKDILADKTMIRGQEPWQVKSGPSR